MLSYEIRIVLWRLLLFIRRAIRFQYVSKLFLYFIQNSVIVFTMYCIKFLQIFIRFHPNFRILLLPNWHQMLWGWKQVEYSPPYSCRPFLRLFCILALLWSCMWMEVFNISFVSQNWVIINWITFRFQLSISGKVLWPICAGLEIQLL